VGAEAERPDFQPATPNFGGRNEPRAKKPTSARPGPAPGGRPTAPRTRRPKKPTKVRQPLGSTKRGAAARKSRRRRKRTSS
jgi:hypothetical protein